MNAPIPLALNIHFAPTRAAQLRGLRGTGDEPAIDGETAAAILGVHPRIGPWDVYRDRREGVALPARPHAERAERWSARALDDYLSDVAASFRRVDGHAVLCHSFRDWARDAVVALVRAPQGVGGVLAVFDTSDATWGEPGTVIEAWTEGCEEWLPPHLAIRAYWLLEASGLAFWDVAALRPRAGGTPELVWVRVLRDAQVQGQILRAVERWRERCLVDGSEPALDGSKSCTDFLRRRFPGPARDAGAKKTEDRPMRPATTEEAELVWAMQAARRREQAAQEELRALRNRLTARIGDAYGLTVPTSRGSTGRALWIPVSGRRDIDRQRLRSQYPEVWKDCLKVGPPTRHLRLMDLG